MTSSTSYLILPLYKKGVEKILFDRAILWLKRNVQQILMAVGVEYEVNKNILFNIDKIFNLYAPYGKIAF